jgi:hypothetical protein
LNGEGFTNFQRNHPGDNLDDMIYAEHAPLEWAKQVEGIPAKGVSSSADQVTGTLRGKRALSNLQSRLWNRKALVYLAKEVLLERTKR